MDKGKILQKSWRILSCETSGIIGGYFQLYAVILVFWQSETVVQTKQRHCILSWFTRQHTPRFLKNFGSLVQGHACIHILYLSSNLQSSFIVSYKINEDREGFIINGKLCHQSYPKGTCKIATEVNVAAACV